AGLIVAAFAVGFWIHDHVREFWARVQQAFTVVRTPVRYLRTVVVWQAGDWCLRLVAVWFLLAAFCLPPSLQNVLLVPGSARVATALPLTPAGIGTEQAFLLYVFRGTVASSKLLAFSVGLKLVTVGTNVIAGFAAIAITLRTIRYKKALEAAATEET